MELPRRRGLKRVLTCTGCQLRVHPRRPGEGRRVAITLEAALEKSPSHPQLMGTRTR